MKQSRYAGIIEFIFLEKHQPGLAAFDFERKDMERAAAELQIELPKNLGDALYTFRSRSPLPKSITDTAPEGREWIIRLAGRGKYRFLLTEFSRIKPNPHLRAIKVMDSTPEIVRRYALSDEQALLAQVRWNRLIDIFLGLTCYSLQNHLRTTVEDMGQIEVDEIYVGVNSAGTQFIVPVQAKGGSDQLTVVQSLQDMSMCAQSFPNLICRAVSVQFIVREGHTTIALFEVGRDGEQPVIEAERHYRLVQSADLSDEEIAALRSPSGF